MVDGLSVSGLETLSIGSAEAVRLLETAGAGTPDRPCLLVIEDDRVEVKSGWAMRSRLARLIGARRGTALARLAIAE